MKMTMSLSSAALDAAKDGVMKMSSSALVVADEDDECPMSSALDAAEDGTMKMSSSALVVADEDVNESVVSGAGCGQGRDDENMLIASAGDGL